jgi:hypothetical protein
MRKAAGAAACARAVAKGSITIDLEGVLVLSIGRVALGPGIFKSERRGGSEVLYSSVGSLDMLWGRVLQKFGQPGRCSGEVCTGDNRRIIQ